MSDEAVATASKKEEIFQKLQNILEKTSNDDFEHLSAKSIRQELTGIFGDEVQQYKAEIKETITQHCMQHLPPPNEEAEEEEEEEEEEESDEEDEEEESDDDGDDPEIEALPEEWKAQFETIVWVKTSKQFPWTPCIIYNPSALQRKLKTTAMKHLGKKHVVYYYGFGQWDYATPKQIKPFTENMEALSAQKVSKRYQVTFSEGVELAQKELKLPKDERASWMHRQKKKRVKKVVKTVVKAAPTPPPAAVSKAKAKAKAMVPVKGKKAASKKTTKVSKKSSEEATENSEQDEKASSEPEEEEEEEDEVEEEEEEEEEEEAEFDDEDDDDQDEAEGEAYVEEKPKKGSSKRKASSKESDSGKTKKRARSTGDKKTDGEVGEVVKKKKKVLSDEEKEARKKEKKDRDKATEKNGSGGKSGGSEESKKRKAPPSSSKDQPLTAAQKKKLVDEKNVIEKNRISQMKSSSEPVWKQARASTSSSSTPSSSTKPSTSTSTSSTSSTTNSTTSSTTSNGTSSGTSSGSSQQKKAVSAASRPLEETPVERARRLSQLIDGRIKAEEKKKSGQFDATGIIKIMRKARNMELTLTEWAESKFIELVTTLRKYPKSTEIANEAKEIRSYLKNKMTTMAAASGDTTTSSSSSSASSEEVSSASTSSDKPTDDVSDSTSTPTEVPQLPPADGNTTTA